MIFEVFGKIRRHDCSISNLYTAHSSDIHSGTGNLNNHLENAIHAPHFAHHHAQPLCIPIFKAHAPLPSDPRMPR
ncbi:hypothetical protein Y023_5394 [Burkholderia pseudomallei A79D]|nr:hypothetical protein DO65_5805 [Burkholderia pseudomallei]KGS22131.1 hypothetical protein X962_5350 [Burkholderia pseudomallei MSHR7343]KGS36495.1 hypothetical protein X945_5556 [Burkholderia pseudomallei ABCPW 107]KGX95526.1 hypothetical protein Y023_5394 [Burkholderia pseudomallei A79D]KGX96225.1 hypothetical protein X997_5179 [Burkholderia pseudomallei A79C]